MKKRKLLKPLSTDENGMRRVRHFTRNIASRIEAEAQRADDPAAVAQAVGEQLQRQVPAAFPDAEAKSVSLACMKSLAPVITGARGVSDKGGGARYSDERDNAHALAVGIGAAAIPVRQKARVLQQLCGESGAPRSALRDFLKQTAAIRCEDPAMRASAAAPRRKLNPSVFRNNVKAVSLVLSIWTGAVALTGMKADLNRPPPGVKPQKDDDVVACERGWSPTSPVVNLVLGDDGVEHSDEYEERRRHNVLRTKCTGDDIFERVKQKWSDLAATGCGAT